MAQDNIEAFHDELQPEDRAICQRLRQIIDARIPEADSRIWHGHPVWFLKGNPIVGYKKLKDCLRLLFWSGQGFETPGLKPEGKFKAAEVRYTEAGQVDEVRLVRWLEEARFVQWDYKNIVKRKGVLKRLSSHGEGEF